MSPRTVHLSDNPSPYSGQGREDPLESPFGEPLGFESLDLTRVFMGHRVSVVFLPIFFPRGHDDEGRIR